jgi:hypothetical protein
VPLRPLTFSEILDGAFQAIRTNPNTMLGFAAVVLSVTSLLTLFPQAWLQQAVGMAASQAAEQADPTAFLDAGLTAVLTVLPTMVLTWLAVVVLNALLVVAVSAAVLGEKTSPGQLWQRVRGQVASVIGLSLLTGLIVAAASTVAGGMFVVPAVFLFAGDQPWAGAALLLLGVFAALAAGVSLWVRTSLAGPALLLEQNSVPTALRRSWQLVTGSFWRVLFIFVVVGVLTYLTSLLIQVPFSGVAVLLDLALDNTTSSQWGPTLISTAVNAVGQTVAGTIVNPWSAAVVALVYIDLRMRREGLDLELIRASNTGTPS